MRWVALLLAGLFLATATPTSAASEALPDTELLATEACIQPCGYIVPIIDLDFPTKEMCGGGRFIYAEETPDDCTPVPALGESWAITGTFRMWWDAQEEPTYPILPDAPIDVTFSGTASNPDWLDLKVEPSTFQLATADLYDPANYDIDPNRTPAMYFDYRQEITVTFTRTGDPDQRWLDKLDDRHGVTPNFLKARSSASGQYYREAFGVEEFRFNSCADAAINACGEPVRQDESIPGFGLGLLVAAVASTAYVRRR